MVTTRLGRRYGPSRTRWLFIGFILGLMVGMALSNPEIGVTDLLRPSTYIEILPFGG